MTFNFKFILVGDTGVGKSSIVSKFISNNFSPIQGSTIGIDRFSKKIKVQNKEAKLDIWDPSGRKGYRPIWPPHYKNAVGILLVYDITKSESFDNIPTWYTDVATHANSFAVFLLVGNKNDLNEKREVAVDEAQQFAESYGFLFTETSAIHSQNISQLFELLATEVYSRHLSGVYTLTNQKIMNHKGEIVDTNEERNVVVVIVFGSGEGSCDLEMV